MVIAIHSLLPFEEETDHHFFVEIFSRITRSHTQDQFIFITNDNFKERFQGKNVSFVHPGEIPKNRLYAPIWHVNKLKKILKDKKPDLLIHTHLFIANTEIPQILFHPEVNFDNQPKDISRLRHLSDKKSAALFSKAKKVIVKSKKEKASLAKKYPSIEIKTRVVLPGVNTHKLELTFDERESLKEEIAAGNEYFIYSGTISPQKNLVNLLKAFSAFKKRQRSGMKLIITGKPGIDFELFSASLKTYKYREQVKLLTGLTSDEESKIFAAGYALIIPSSFESSAEKIFFAMQNSVPVVTSVNSIAVELCGESGIYFDPNNIKDIAEKLMFIFKDEDKRKESIELGKGRIHLFDWDRSAEEVSGIIFQQ